MSWSFATADLTSSSDNDLPLSKTVTFLGAFKALLLNILERISDTLMLPGRNSSLIPTASFSHPKYLIRGIHTTHDLNTRGCQEFQLRYEILDVGRLDRN